MNLEIVFDSIEARDEFLTVPPPEGVHCVTNSCNEGGGDSGFPVWIQFANDVHDVGLGVLAAWLYDRFIKCDKKSCRINNKKTVLNKRNIRRLIKTELANQIGREKQRRTEKHRTPKKRP